MKCEECLTVIEEYFDGELDRKTSELVTAHAAHCADCADALEALGAEQEIYARYERRDLEGVTTPALWQAVQSRISEEKHAPSPAPFAARLRERFAAAFAALSFTPAFAGSMALVLVGVAVGVIGFSRSEKISLGEIAQRIQNDAVDNNSNIQTVPASPELNEIKQGGGDQDVPIGESAGVVYQPGKILVSRDKDLERVRRQASVSAAASPATNQTAADFRDDHLLPDDGSLNPVQPLETGADTIQTVRASQFAEDVEVARHVEKTQQLLRSFKNVNYTGDADAGEVAYEKQLSKSLLNENIVLRRDAEVEGNLQAKQVLNTIEPFLLDIANLGDKPSPEDVRSIKDRMQKKEIIAALHVY